MKYAFIIFVLGILSLWSPAVSLAATLSLNPSVATFNKGCYGSIKIDLDTASAETDGTDVILKYAPIGNLSQITIVNGTIYNEYPGSNVDTQAGKITVAGLASVTQPYNGKGTLATINFFIPESATGSATMTFEFDPNDKAKTTDTNVFERGTIADVLNSVVNGNYTIGGGTCASSGITPGATPPGRGGVSTPSATPAPGYLPPAGTQEFTFMIAIIATTLTVLGLIGFFIL